MIEENTGEVFPRGDVEDAKNKQVRKR